MLISYWKTPILLSGVDWMRDPYAVSDECSSRQDLMRGSFRLIMTNGMCDLGSSGVLHHIQSCTCICPPPAPTSTPLLPLYI